MPLSIMPLSINDTLQNTTGHFAQCSVDMLGVAFFIVMLSVAMLNVIMLSVVAPLLGCPENI